MALGLSQLTLAATTFRVQLYGDIESLDWNLVLATSSSSVSNNIMEGLYEIDEHLTLKPRLAESSALSADRLTYTIKIRSGVLWSDGKPLRAQDFVDSWQRLLDPRMGSNYSYLLFKIAGAETFHSKPSADFSLVGVKALDDRTISVTLARPCEYFLQLLATRVTFPIRADLVKKYGVQWTDPDKLVVLGPYVVASRDRGKGYILKRNPRYYGPQPPMEEIRLIVVPTQAAALAMFEAGQLDFLPSVNPIEAARFLKTPAAHVEPAVGTQYLYFNTRQFPFTLPKARQAIAMAIDFAKLAALRGSETARAMSLVPPQIMPESKVPSFSFDPIAAQALLKEIGIESKLMPKFEMLGLQTPEDTQVLDFIKSELKKNLNLEATISQYPFTQFRLQITARQGALIHYDWAADFVDPDTFLEAYISTSGANRPGWKNARYDELIKQGSSMTSGPERTKVYVEAIDILQRQEAVVIPLFHPKHVYLLNPKARGLVLSPTGNLSFRTLRL